MLNWIKKFNKDTDDPNAHLVRRLYKQYLKEGDKKNKIIEHYDSVIRKGNQAEKKVYDVINETLRDSYFSGVSNIRIDSKYDKMGKQAAEFDFIIEDMKLVLYINVKSSDETNRQPDQIKRHQEILVRLIPNGKELRTLSVNTSQDTWCNEFQLELKKYALNQENNKTGQDIDLLQDDVFCNILLDIDTAKIHIDRIIQQFDISDEDFIDKDRYIEFIKDKNRISYQFKNKTAMESYKIVIQGKIKKVVPRIAKGKPTDILEIEKNVYVPVGTAQMGWEGKNFSGTFVKEQGTKPPYIVDEDMDKLKIYTKR